MSYLGPFVLSRLQAKKWNQRDLAGKTGIKESTLNRYISGTRTPPDRVIEKIAQVLEVSQETLRIAQGQIPDRLHRLLYENADTTLSVLNRLAVKISKRSNHIEDLARGVLFRYLQVIGRSNFKYPIDIRNLLQLVYGITIHEVSFRGIELPKTKGELCGLFVPGYARLGDRHYSNAVLLNSDVVQKYGVHRAGDIGRFTMAHEAFHKEMWDSREILSRGTRNVVYCRIQSIPVDEEHDFRTERQANRFAGALLMPTKAVLKLVSSHPCPLDLTACGDVLRSSFGVTKSALKVRLRELGVSFIESRCPSI